jgi:hypothetical protein
MTGDGGTVLTFPQRGGDTYPPTDPNPNQADPPPVNPIACQALENAYRLIEGDRHVQHGKAEKCHDAIADLWTWWTGFKIDRHDVAMMMALLKIARMKTGAYNSDTFDDSLGYLSLAKQFRHTEATPR